MKRHLHLKKHTKRWIWLTMSFLGLVVLACVGYYVYLDFFHKPPVGVPKTKALTYLEVPDNTNYASLEQRAEAALKVAKNHRLDQKYCIFVDYGIPSGQPRLFVWSFKDRQVVAKSYVMHGPGMGSTAAKPVFSNKPGSNCSSLGRFVVTGQHGSKLTRSYRLNGFDKGLNDNSFNRGILIHGSMWVDAQVAMGKKYIALHSPSCQGCVTVSSQGLDYLEDLIAREDKHLLLWSYCSEA